MFKINSTYQTTNQKNIRFKVLKRARLTPFDFTNFIPVFPGASVSAGASWVLNPGWQTLLLPLIFSIKSSVLPL